MFLPLAVSKYSQTALLRSHGAHCGRPASHLVFRCTGVSRIRHGNLNVTVEKRKGTESERDTLCGASHREDGNITYMATPAASSQSVGNPSRGSMLVAAIALAVFIFAIAGVLENIAAALSGRQALEILSPRSRVHGEWDVCSIRLN